MSCLILVGPSNLSLYRNELYLDKKGSKWNPPKFNYKLYRSVIFVALHNSKSKIAFYFSHGYPDQI